MAGSLAKNATVSKQDRSGPVAAAILAAVEPGFPPLRRAKALRRRDGGQPGGKTSHLTEARWNPPERKKYPRLFRAAKMPPSTSGRDA